MTSAWQILRGFFVCVALSGPLVASPVWARATGHHPADSQPKKPSVHHLAPARGRPPPVRRNPPHYQNTAKTNGHHATARTRPLIVTARTRPLIVIDPGHGGKDPGAVGVSGTLEKNVALAAALDLKRLLETTGRYRVAMTRTSDVFVTLAARVAFARSHQASLVIAIHANASSNSRAQGASVWVRSHQDSGSEVTHLATAPRDATDIADALAGPKSQPRPDSGWLQSTMIDNLNDDIRMDAAPTRQAHFYVLGLHDVPSALLEMGFLSNRHDEALLNQAKYRQTVARAIRDAIDDYFAKLKHPSAVRT